MKFKDKDGNVFASMGSAYAVFCCNRVCESEECELYELTKAANIECMDWAIAHPAEAARLMGYEIIEEDLELACYREGGCGPYENRACNECPASKPEYTAQKEANMGKQKPVAENTAMKEAKALEAQGFSVAEKQKPRICEVLGVEVGERFTAKTPFGNFNRCEISGDGMILNTGTNILCYIINHPDSILCQPRFTEEEVADAKVLCRALGLGWLARDDGFVLCHYKKEPKLSDGEFCADGYTVFIQKGMFPSIRPGQSVKLADIIGDAP